jgi:acetyltransferase-like isoleucine patch superfamily enzyme
VRVGEGCEILANLGTFGTEPYLIEIGDRVTLSYDVLLITHDGSSRLYRHRHSSSPWGNRFGPVRVLDDSFVGARAILLPGVTVGPRSIVGAGSVVTKDVPPDTVWAGNPARQVATVAEAEERYARRMVALSDDVADRRLLRKELTEYFFGEQR